MRAQNLTGVECPFDVRVGAGDRALADRPPGGRIVLRLHAAEPRHDVARCAQSGRDETLVDEAKLDELRAIQW